jgi:aminopeptidase
VRFEGGRAVEIDADEGAETFRTMLGRDEGAVHLGEVALVDGEGRIGALATTFYDTLLDENAASHLAVGQGFPFVVKSEDDRRRVNVSAIHVDFMIGSPELAISGVTRDGDTVPVLIDGHWQV